MGKTSDKLNYLNTTKTQIFQAVRNKGVTVPTNTTFRGIVSKINAIPAMVIGGGNATNEIDLILVGGYGSINTNEIKNFMNGKYMYKRSN